MSVQKPLRYGIDNQSLLSSQPTQAIHNLIDERPQVARHAAQRSPAAHIPFQIPPFAFFSFRCGLYFANQIRCSHAARSANARALAALVWHEAWSRTKKTSRPVAVCH